MTKPPSLPGCAITLHHAPKRSPLIPYWPTHHMSHPWLNALKVYTHPRVVGMLFLGFSAGLPLLLVLGTLSF